MGDCPIVLWWVRDDLRLADNPALLAAARTGSVVALHVDENIDGVRKPGAASRWWLHQSLTALAADLREHGVPLVVASGDPAEEVPRVVSELGAARAVWNRRYHRPQREADATVAATLRARGVETESFASFLLHEPGTVTTASGTDYQVYSAFARACRSRPAPRPPRPRPRDLRGPARTTAVVAGHRLSTWLAEGGFEAALARRDWLPTSPDWAGGLRATWVPGEAAARARLDELGDILESYEQTRDRPDLTGTSRLSPRLRFGELSPHQVWQRSIEHASEAESSPSAAMFRNELLWREFAWHRRAVHPQMERVNIRRRFDDFTWDNDPEALRAWQWGRTGVPLVDAGMRELWETGFMHNRVRMVTASFLVKNLRQDWRAGEQWFWDTLVDADEGANPFNWQWVAGSGDDAAPYFRIFNPQRQAERFDPHGEYVDRWVPEDDLRREPIVDLAQSRREALAEFRRLPR